MRLLLLPFAAALAAQAPADPARALFQSGAVLDFELELEATAQLSLREQPRQYVPCRATVDGRTRLPRIGLKLKGAAGSFRDFDDKPALTLRLDRFGGSERVSGLAKLHLNNSVQDDTFLCEWLGAGVFAAAELPAARVAFARVRLAGSDRGLYVLREAYDQGFLRRCGSSAGNLYDGGFCEDVDGELEKDAGSGADDRGDLRELARVCRLPAAERRAALPAVLDVEQFVDFVALEALLGHWDGYSQNHNNYRLWIGGDGRAHFLPHGMDQLLGDPEASVLRHPTAIVADAVLQLPEWRQRYRQRLTALLPLLQPTRLQPLLRAQAAKLRPVLHAIEPELASAHAEAVRGLLQRLEQRYRFLLAETKAPEPKPMAFDGERPQLLKDWRPGAETEAIELERRRVANVPALLLACSGRGDAVRAGAFRTTVLLARGRYRLLASVRCEGLRVPEEKVGEAGGGEGDDEPAGAWIAGGGARSGAVHGDRAFTPLGCDFEVGEFQREVELELRLRAVAGRAAFRADSLQLLRLGD